MQVPMRHAAVDALLPASAYIPGVHAVHGGHVVRAGAVVPPIRCDDADATAWIGAYVTVQGDIRHAGSVVLSRGSVVWEGIRGGLQVVVGAGCIVDGPIRCDGNVVVQAGADVRGPITAGNDVHLLGDCKVRDVTCRGDVFIAGAPETGRLAPDGRVQTRPW